MVGQWFGAMAELRTPSVWPRALKRLVAGSADAADLLSPDGLGRARRMELANKAEVARWICRAGEYLSSESGPLEPSESELPPAVQKALETAPEDRVLWLLEGIAYHYFRRHLRRTDDLEDVRLPRVLGKIPRQARPIMCTGLGLAVADWLVDSQPRGADPSQVAGSLDRCLDRCRELRPEDHADPQARASADLVVEGIALESIGQWVCVRRRSWLASMGEALKGRDFGGAEADRLLWHGAGRGLYLAPIRKLPGYGSLDDALSAVHGFGLPPEAKADLVSGLGFGFFAIHMGSPKVVETLLYRRRREVGRLALGRGLAAAVEMRRLMPGGDGIVASFLEHRSRHPAFWRAWIVDTLAEVSGPGQESLHRLVGIRS